MLSFFRGIAGGVSAAGLFFAGQGTIEIHQGLTLAGLSLLAFVVLNAAINRR